jgi:glutaminyl-tRNA synthetase
MNPESFVRLSGAILEPSLASAEPCARVQFERHGFFFADPDDSRPGAPIFNRTVALKDSWAKQVQGAEKPAEKPTPARPAPAQKAAAARPVTEAASEKLSAEAEKLVATHGISGEQARLLSESPALLRLFQEAVATGADEKLLARFTVNEAAAALRVAGKATPAFSGAALAELVALIEARTLSVTSAKDVLGEMAQSGGKPSEIVARRGLAQLDNEGELRAIVERVLSSNAALVERYRAGNANVVGALVGMVMRETQNRANPKLTGELLRKMLG